MNRGQETREGERERWSGSLDTCLAFSKGARERRIDGESGRWEGWRLDFSELFIR